MSAYCLFCHSGKENEVMKSLERKGFSTLAPYVVQWTSGAKQTRKRLLPGYVFFETDEAPSWRVILSESAVLRALRYEDGEYALRGRDLEFIDWLRRYKDGIDISTAIQVGTKLKFIDGPLAEFNAVVAVVNKKRRQVKLQIGDEGSLLREIWCSFDIVRASVEAG